MATDNRTARTPVLPRWLRRFALAGVIGSLVVAGSIALEVGRTWTRYRSEVVALKRSVPERTEYMEVRALEGSAPRHRRWVPLDALPAVAVCSVVNAEDPYFFAHGAVDWEAQRALFTRVLHGDFSRGGSGISQQLARNLFLAPERTLRRKLRE